MADVSERDATLDAGRMTIWEHLAELRKRILRCLEAFVAGMVITWIVYERLFRFLVDPLKDVAPNAKLVLDSPTAGFALRLQVCMYGGLVIGMPVILWQVWRFVTPGLYPHEKRYAVPFVVSSLFLFLFGSFIAYITLNPALTWLISVAGMDFEQFYKPEEYVKLIAFMMIAFGAGFEFPVLLVALQIAGVLTPRRLAGWRRQAVVVIAIVAAVITPSGDPISMAALGAPMYVFYECSILIGWILTRRRRRAAAAA